MLTARLRYPGGAAPCLTQVEILDEGHDREVSADTRRSRSPLWIVISVLGLTRALHPCIVGALELRNRIDSLTKT